MLSYNEYILEEYLKENENKIRDLQQQHDDLKKSMSGNA
jgi:hypothetical protein